MRAAIKPLFFIFLFIISGCGDLLSKSVFDADGSITEDEIQHFLSGIKEAVQLTEKQERCIYSEVKERAEKLGDPDTLDPSSVELLPVKEWKALDKAGKRLILTQVIVNQASQPCL